MVTAPLLPAISEFENKSLTVNDAIYLVMEHCKATSKSPRDAIVDIKPQLSRLSSEDRWDLIVYALSKIVSYKLGKSEFVPAPQSPKAVAPIDRRRISVLLAVYSVGIGGARKPLIDFTADDFQIYTKSVLREAAHLKRRVETSEFCRNELTKHNARTVRELPPESIKLVEDAWRLICD